MLAAFPLEHSGIDFEHLDRGVELQVNGRECAFSQELRPQDDVAGATGRCTGSRARYVGTEEVAT
mgnify:CR=1 FL=1